VDTEQMLYDSAESNPRETGKARTEFCVKQSSGVQPYLAQAREILCRRMQDPLFGSNDVIEFAEIADCGGVKQKGASTPAENLNEVGALRIAIAACALGIDPYWPISLSYGTNGGKIIIAIIKNNNGIVGGLGGV
jgi:hypothetical protein